MATYAPGFAGPGIPLYPTQGGDINAANVNVVAGGLIREQIDASGSGAALLFETIEGGGTFESMSIQPVFTFESQEASTEMLAVTNSLTNFAQIAVGGLQLYQTSITPFESFGCSVTSDGFGNLVVNGNPLRYCGREQTVADVTTITLGGMGFSSSDYQVFLSYNGGGPFVSIPSAVITSASTFDIHCDSGAAISWLAMATAPAV